jgi:hypothetical protein
MSRKFSLGCVLSVTTGRLLSPKGVDGLYEILNYMTGDNLFTHALPRASKEATPHILRQYPQLADVDASSVTRENWKQWLAEQVAKYGEELELTPIAEGEYTPRNPLEELTEMVGGDKSKVVVVVKPEHE